MHLIYILISIEIWKFKSTFSMKYNTENIIIETCLSKVSKSFIMENETVAVILDNNHLPSSGSLISPILLDCYRNTYFIINVDKNIILSSDIRPASYWIQIDNVDKLFYQVIILRKNTSNWNSHAKFFIVLPKSKILTHVCKQILSFFRNLSVYQVVIFLRENESVFAYYWRPFAKGSNCGENIENINFQLICHKQDVLINKLESIVSLKDDHIYYECAARIAYSAKSPLDFKNRNVVKVPGIDLFDIIAQKLRIKSHYIESANKLLEEVLNFTNDKWDIYLDAFDLLIENQTNWIQNYFKYYDPSFPYLYGSIGVCRSNKALLSANLILSETISAESLYLYLFLVLISFVAYLLSNRFQEEYFKNDFMKCMLHSTQLLIGSPVNVLPKTKALRLLCAAYIIFSQFYSIIFQSLGNSFPLTKILSSPGNDKTTGYKGNVHYLENMEAIMNVVAYNANNSFHGLTCLNYTKCLLDVLTKNEDAIIILKLQRLYLMQHNSLSNLGISLNCVKHPHSFPVYMLIRKGFPLLSVINKFIARVTAAGLMDKWVRETVSLKNYPKEYPQRLLSDIWIYSYYLLKGYILGIIALIIEICWYKSKISFFKKSMVQNKT